MDLPPSALLGRLQAFLPEMEKANRTTERLFADGKLDVIDANLAVATDQQHEDEGGEATDNEDEAEEEVEDGIQGGRNWPDGAREEGASGDCRTVQLVRRQGGSMLVILFCVEREAAVEDSWVLPELET